MRPPVMSIFDLPFVLAGLELYVDPAGLELRDLLVSVGIKGMGHYCLALFIFFFEFLFVWEAGLFYIAWNLLYRLDQAAFKL